MERAISFEEVVNIYDYGVDNYTNSVYEKSDLYVTIVLQTDETVELVSNSSKMDEFIVLNDFYEALSDYRAKKLTAEYVKTDKLSIGVKTEAMEFVFENSKLHLVFSKSKRPNATNFEVEKNNSNQ